MLIDEMHHQYVRAVIRMHFGSIADFEREKGLPERSVHDVLRGRKSAKVKRAIESVLIKEADTAAHLLPQLQNRRRAA